MFAWIKKQRHINKTRRELNSLTDRELRDIGIARSNINQIAKGL